MRRLLAFLLSAVTVSSASAADLTVTLKTASGQPVADAVVSFRPAAGAPAPRSAGPYVMDQDNIQFHPFVLVVPVGSDVTFPNHDKVRHHVYSFSAAKRFELKLYGREQARAVKFDKPGIVAIGCNIHDNMSAFIDVVDTPYAAKTDGHGEVTLNDIPAGAGVLTVWHPYLKSPRNEQVRSVAAGGRQAFVLDLRAPPAAMTMAMP